MEIKAQLKIKLIADDVLVAESSDAVLWNKVLQATLAQMSKQQENYDSPFGEEAKLLPAPMLLPTAPASMAMPVVTTEPAKKRGRKPGQKNKPKAVSVARVSAAETETRRGPGRPRREAASFPVKVKTKPTAAVSGLASQWGVSLAAFEEALSFFKTAPYMKLHTKAVKAFRNNVPSRGKHAISLPVLTATLLCLWFEKAGLGDVTVTQIRDVLEAHGEKTQNIYRALQGCRWLVYKDSDIRLNRKKIKTAEAIAQSFVTLSPLN